MTIKFDVDEQTLIESLIPQEFKCEPPEDQWFDGEFISDVNKRRCMKHDNRYSFCIQYYEEEYNRIKEVLNQYLVE